jgi:hypothetical protein
MGPFLAPLAAAACDRRYALGSGTRLRLASNMSAASTSATTKKRIGRSLLPAIDAARRAFLRGSSTRGPILSPRRAEPDGAPLSLLAFASAALRADSSLESGLEPGQLLAPPRPAGAGSATYDARCSRRNCSTSQARGRAGSTGPAARRRPRSGLRAPSLRMTRTLSALVQPASKDRGASALARPRRRRAAPRCCRRPSSRAAGKPHRARRPA